MVEAYNVVLKMSLRHKTDHAHGRVRGRHRSRGDGDETQRMSRRGTDDVGSVA